MNQITTYNPQQIAPSMTAERLQALMSSWIADLSQRVDAQEISQDTANGYRRGAGKFFSWLTDQQPTSEAIRAWKADLLKAGTRPASVNAWLAGLRSYLGWLAEVGQIPFNPAEQIKGATRKGTKK